MWNKVILPESLLLLVCIERSHGCEGIFYGYNNYGYCTISHPLSGLYGPISPVCMYSEWSINFRLNHNQDFAHTLSRNSCTSKTEVRFFASTSFNNVDTPIVYRVHGWYYEMAGIMKHFLLHCRPCALLSKVIWCLIIPSNYFLSHNYLPVLYTCCSSYVMHCYLIDYECVRMHLCQTVLKRLQGKAVVHEDVVITIMPRLENWPHFFLRQLSPAQRLVAVW